MAHILCITSGLRGLLNASFELLARLEGAGHRVTYACPHDVRAAVEAQGLRYLQLPPVNFDPAPAPQRVDGPLGGLRSRVVEWRSARARRKAGVEALNMGPFTDIIAREQPDLVLLDSELYEHIFCLYALKTPMALLTPFFAAAKRRGLPPLQLGVTPGKNGVSDSDLERIWLKHRLRRWRQVRMISLRNAFTERRQVLLAYARQCGFPVQQLEQFGWTTLFNDTHLPTISLTARELEFEHDERDNFYYAGPMVALQRQEERVSEASRARLSDLYARRASGPDKLLYCGLTTMDKQGTDFLQRIVAAVEQQPGWQLIVGCSGNAQTLERDVPQNVHIFDYVPQIDILRHTDLCVTYGGINTVHECLTLGVPMLLYPRFNDQPGVTARLVKRGLGYRGDVDLDSADQIGRRIEQALNDADLRERVHAMAQVFARYRDTQVVESLVDRIVSDRPSD